MLLAVLALVVTLPARVAQGIDDPALRGAVERFYASQQAEDAAAYFALWSRTAQRPTAEQLQYVFDSGDDKFSDITILRVTPMRDGIVVRVSVTRERTSTAFRRPDGSPIVNRSPMTASLEYVREDGEWTLVREGPPADALATLLVDAASPEEREQLMASEPELVGIGLLMSLLRRADTFSRLQQYPRALDIYDRALEIAHRIGNTKLESEALQNIGNARYFQRNFPAALTAFERRLALEREAANDEGIASALLGVATVRYSQFEYSEALSAYREALAIQERLKDEPGQATTLIGTGNIQYLQGDFGRAIEDYRRSRALSRKSMDTIGEARALEGLGRTFSAQGDFAAALESYAAVLEEGRARSDRLMQGNALQSIGEIHFRLGNLDTARAHFDQGRSHFEAMKDLANAGRMWQATALTDLVAGRFAAAEQEYATSGRTCAAAQDNDCIARATVGLAFAQASQEHFDAAVVSYGKAIAAFGALRKRENAARAEIGLSHALLGQKDYSAALAAAGRARDQALAIAREDVLWRARLAEARALRRLGDAARTMAAAKDAVATVERMARTALERPGDAVPADSGGAYALLAVLLAEAGDASGAFAVVEQRRAQALRVALATNERDIARGMTPAEREDERAAVANLVSLRAQLDHEQALPKPDTARVVRLEQSLAAAAAQRTAARQQLFERLPDLRIWRGLAAPVTPDEAAAAFPDADTVVAEFVIDDEDLLAITVVRRVGRTEFDAHVTPISRQALAERVAHAVDPAVLRSIEEWGKASADLVSAIPSDAWRALTAAPRAIIVPDGVLWRVPFEALRAGDGYLADHTAVLYAGSVTALVRAPAASSAPASVPLVAIGAPELPESIRARVTATAPGWTLRASDAADAEIRVVAARFTEPAAVMLSGAAATEGAFRAQAPAAAALHLAAPFRMNGASPLFSPLLLSPGRSPRDDRATGLTAPATGSAVSAGRTPEPPVSADPTPDPAASAEPSAENDGALETREVMNLDLRARVAVFSDGAATSMRDAAPAAETIRWAWRAAGVPSIVISRWSGDDGTAATMLADFYVRLQSGDAADSALQSARAALRAREQTRAPYFWAGWMLIGR